MSSLTRNSLLLALSVAVSACATERMVLREFAKERATETVGIAHRMICDYAPVGTVRREYCRSEAQCKAYIAFCTQAELSGLRSFPPAKE